MSHQVLIFSEIWRHLLFLESKIQMQLWWFHERLLMQEGHSVFCCQDEELGRIVYVFFSNYFATSHRVRKFGASQTMPNIRLDNGFQYHFFIIKLRKNEVSGI